MSTAPDRQASHACRWRMQAGNTGLAPQVGNPQGTPQHSKWGTLNEHCTRKAGVAGMQTARHGTARHGKTRAGTQLGRKTRHAKLTRGVLGVGREGGAEPVW